jgi:cytochrome oxidase Cu insertion factor (SCO1/SenC/PrrC family)
MPEKKKKKESWKEKRRRAALKRERALEAERIRREKEPKKKHKGWPRGKVFGALFLISLCLISYGVWQYTQPPTQSLSPEPPSPPPNENKAPSFTLTDIDEATFSLADFKGKVVVLDFFYIRCGYCDDEFLELEEIYGKYSRDDVVIISISIDPNYDTVERLQEFKIGPNSFSSLEYEMTWRIARDTAGVSNKYDITAAPTTVIIDREGIISPHSSYVGLTDASKLSEEIDLLLRTD